MTEERHECKTYSEMLAVLRKAKANGHTAWWNSEELRNGELIVYVRKDGKDGKGGKENEVRTIDADALINEIKKETKKAIDQDDKVGSFWLGYIAGLVIKEPTIQSALDPETLIRTIETGITATNSRDAYSLGMRNGMRWCKSLIDGVEPKFEDDVMRVDNGVNMQPTIQPGKAQLSQEGTTSDMISRQALCEYALNQKDKSVTPNDIMRFPSAKPEYEPVTAEDLAKTMSENTLYNYMA